MSKENNFCHIKNTFSKRSLPGNELKSSGKHIPEPIFPPNDKDKECSSLIQEPPLLLPARVQRLERLTPELKHCSTSF